MQRQEHVTGDEEVAGHPTERPATADRLRHEIDSGHTGDKVSAPDPAAAPLGTDDEAAGAPPAADRLELAARHRPLREPEPPSPDLATRRVWLMLAAAALACVVVGAAAIALGQ
jgi:hypothetical protein